MSIESYINECANCEQIDVMKPKDDVPAGIWLNYCPECIDAGDAQQHWNDFMDYRGL